MSDDARARATRGREDAKSRVKRALVLSGGGARGAYEAGVLKYVFGPLAKHLDKAPKIDVYIGTSVGAVNTCFLAGHAHELEAGVSGLIDIWRKMAFERVYRFGIGDAFTFARTAFGSVTGASARPNPKRMHGLLNTKPLEELVIRRIPWRQLRKNIRTGQLDAVCVSATEISTGRTVNFVDRLDHRIDWTHDPLNIARVTRVGPAHTLASAAIPVLFPSVRIKDQYYVDGSLRFASPLTPALRLGANRLLIVGLRRPHVTTLDEPIAAERIAKSRTLGFMLGKVLNAVLIDRLEYDVSHMRVLNRVLQAGVESYGEDYLARINPGVEEERGRGFQVVQDAFVRPSEDIGAIAARHVRRLRREPPRSFIGNSVFRVLTRGAPEGEADLMSYLLFDGKYASDLIDLGFADARRQEEEVARIFME